jgi:hypothetical protein
MGHVNADRTASTHTCEHHNPAKKWFRNQTGHVDCKSGTTIKIQDIFMEEQEVDQRPNKSLVIPLCYVIYIYLFLK